MSIIVLADLRGKGGFVNKDTVAGGYGSRFEGFSVATRFAKNLRHIFQNVPSIHIGYLAAIFARAGHQVIVTRDGREVQGDVALVLTSLVDYKHEIEWAHVVEDCAQAVGARYRGHAVGTFGAASFFSFQLLKGINTYGGGMALTNDKALAKSIRAQVESEPLQTSADLAKRFAAGLVARSMVSPRGFTFWGFPLQAAASFFGHYDLSQHIWEKIRPLAPFPRNYHQRYSNVQAILGLRSLAKLDEFNARSRAHAALYSRGLADCRNIQTPPVAPDVEHVFYQYCIYAQDPARLSRMAIRRGVDFETTHVDVCSSLPLFKEFAARCPGAEMTEQALQLPVYSRLRVSDTERVLQVVRELAAGLASPSSERNQRKSTPPEATQISSNERRAG